MNLAGAVIIGAACLVWWNDRLVLEVQKPHKWRTDEHGKLHVGLGCIGGALEAGEQPLETLQREAVEEMGCAIEVWDAPATYTVTPGRRVHPASWPYAGARPLLVWEACLPGMLPGRSVAVFHGRALGRPSPGDLPALLCVTPEMLLEIGADGLQLGEACARGAVLLAREPIPAAARLRLVDTAAVIHLLKDFLFDMDSEAIHIKQR